jgi:hypothetical protein
MSHDNDHDNALRPYTGTVERPAPLLDVEVPHAWHARVQVTELMLPGRGKTFEVRVTRFGGPRLDGTPDPVGVTIAQVDDVVAEAEGERAREIALRAVEDLRANRIPDLKVLARTVRGGPARPAEI